MDEDRGFWERLTSLPPFADKSQEEIGKVAGVWQTAVGKWALGRGLPTLPRARALAIKGGVCVDWLLTGREPKFPGGSDDPQLAELIELWRTLTADSRRDVLKFSTYARITQTTADPERIADFHAHLAHANARSKTDGKPKK